MKSKNFFSLPIRFQIVDNLVKNVSDSQKCSFHLLIIQIFLNNSRTAIKTKQKLHSIS